MRIHKIRKYVLIALLLFIVYLIIGMLAPFMIQKKIKENKITTSTEKYYGNGIHVDRAKVVETSEDALSQRIRMINNAKKRVILSTFDMREGESSKDIGAALLAAADRGVEIKLLVDGVSGLIRMEGKPFFYALSSYPNIEIRIYNKINILKPWTFNGRMHDKYVIADNTCYLLGGRNTFDYFLGNYTGKNRSYDREILIYNTADENNKSSSLYEVEAYFKKVWNSKYCKVFHNKEKLQSRKSIIKVVKELKERYVSMKSHNKEWFDENYSYETNTVPIKMSKLVSGDIHIYGKEPIVWHEVKNLMANAKERVIFHTPYAVLGKDMYGGMKEISSKVDDFSMVINSVENGDNFMASSDYLRNKSKIIDTGVNLYEFDGGDSSHGKSIVIDDNISIIGSYNLDLRSTYMDTELMLVIDSEELNKELYDYLDVFAKQTRTVIDEDTYENPANLTIEKIPTWKKMALKIVGFVLQPMRYLL